MGFIKSIFSGKKEKATTPTPVDGAFQTLKFDGVRARNMGEFPFAVRCFTEALAIDPSDLETKSYLADTYMRLGKAEKAYPLFEELVATEPDNVALLIALAQAAERTENWQVMQTTCDHAVALEPENEVTLYLCARAYDGQGDKFQSIAYLTRALGVDHKFASALLLRAQIFLRMKQYAEAETDVDALLDTDEPTEEAFVLKADVRRAQGDANGAEQYYFKALDTNPFSQDAILKCGALYIETRVLDKALRLFDEAISNNHNFAEAYKQRGLIKRMLKDDAGAMEDLKRSLELSPEIANGVDGEFSNVENRIEEQYKNRNPYGF